MSITNLPKKIKHLLLIFKGLNLKESVDIIRSVLYLWREFYIVTSIEPVVKEYIVGMTYKDKVLINFKSNDIKGILAVMEDIKMSRVNNIKRKDK